MAKLAEAAHIVLAAGINRLPVHRLVVVEHGVGIKVCLLGDAAQRLVLDGRGLGGAARQDY
ncbi:hypothetical protein D3C81_2236460 [compost metagenome]